MQDFITAQDIENQVEPSFGALGSVVFYRTYSRWLEKEKRRETYAEAMARMVNYNVGLAIGSQCTNSLQEEADLLYKRLNQLLVWGSGRTAWIGGTKATDLTPEATMNCSALIIDRLEAFPEALHLLCLGAGVGFRIYPSDLSQLPKIKNLEVEHKKYYPENWVKNSQENTTIVDNVFHPTEKFVTVGDSREGWCDALRVLLESSTFENKTTKLTFIYKNVRPENTRINGFGGLASGPEPLKQLLFEVNRIINEETKEGKLRSINALDIMCIIGDLVRSGNVRRSSLIALLHPKDQETIDAKKGLWTDPSMANKRYRSMSNNSISYDGYKPSKEELDELITQRIRFEGEPGFVRADKHKERRHNAALKWRPDEDPENYTKQAGITNPCFAPGTLVLTKKGHYPIESLINKAVEIWDGRSWVLIDNFRVTAENQEVFTITLHSGQEITATKYHTFILEDGTKRQLHELKEGDKLLPHYMGVEGIHSEPGAYLKGFLMGDGTSHKNKPLLHLYSSKYMCAQRLINSALEVPLDSNLDIRRSDIEVNPGFSNLKAKTKTSMQGLSARSKELLPWVTTQRKNLGYEILNWDNKSKYEFIAGYMDSDGGSFDTKNGFMYQATSVEKESLQMFQLLLQSIGVKSTLRHSRKSGTKDFGEKKGGVCKVKNAYRITISQESSIKLSSVVSFTRLKDFSNKTTSYKLKDNSNKIRSIIPNGVEEKVYCCTVPTNHQVSLSVGVTTGQCAEISLSGGYKDLKAGSTCNLSSLPLPLFVNKDGRVNFELLEECIRLITRFGVRQTLVNFSLPDWDITQKAERLLGVDICGWIEAFNKMGISTLSEEATQVRKFCSEVVESEATKYSELLGIPRPLLTKTCKPNGTYAQLTTIASGCHAPYAPFYIRRIRVAASDSLARTLVDQKVPFFPESSEWESLYRKNNPETDKSVWEMLAEFDSSKGIPDNIKTLVFEFPVKTSAVRSTKDIPAIEQLEGYKVLMSDYIDHNASITVTCGDDEWQGVSDWIYENWEHVIGISLLPSYADDSYPLLPYSECTEEEYNTRVSSFKTYPISVNLDILSKYEKERDALGEDVDDVSLGSDCSEKGGCPVR